MDLVAGDDGAMLADILEVEGELRLDGVVNIHADSSFTIGRYPIMTHRGCAGSPSIGSAPAGFKYTLDVSDPDHVDLVVGVLPYEGPRLMPVAGTDGGPETNEFSIAETETTAANYIAFLNSRTNGQLAVTNGEVRLTATGDPLCLTTQCDSSAAVQYNEAMAPGSRFAVADDREDHPMILVSWFGAAAYCNWRSEVAELPSLYVPTSSWESVTGESGYRLPTEDEWRKAAGWNPSSATAADYGTGGDALAAQDANYFNSGDSWETNVVRTTPVGSYRTRSPYGLKDAAGNVWEWCHDLYDGAGGDDPHLNAHALRGGSWGNMAGDLRVESRIDNMPGETRRTVGFRYVKGAL